MKRFGFLIISAILAFTMAQAQNKQAKGDMVFDKMAEGIVFHDYGSIVFGANGKVDFNYTNKGTIPLVITDVKSSCGCTVPTWTKEPVEPGKTGTITIMYDTKLAGPFNKTVEVYSNANNSPVRISVKGKVNAKPADITNQIQSADKSKENSGGLSIASSPDSAQKAQAVRMQKARETAQQESFKKLTEQPSTQKPKTTTVTPVPEKSQTTPPVTNPEGGPKKKK